jgi:hypothetical protein
MKQYSLNFEITGVPVADSVPVGFVAVIPLGLERVWVAFPFVMIPFVVVLFVGVTALDPANSC